MAHADVTVDQKIEYNIRAFKEHIRTLMKDKGISQERAAKELNITPVQFSFALTGATFTVEQLMRLFNLLDVESKNIGAIISIKNL